MIIIQDLRISSKTWDGIPLTDCPWVSEDGGASKNVFVPRPRTEAAKRALSYRGAVMWNGLENVLKDEIIPTLSSLPCLCLEPQIALRELR